jgi:hypothetical protein
VNPVGWVRAELSCVARPVVGAKLGVPPGAGVAGKLVRPLGMVCIPAPGAGMFVVVAGPVRPLSGFPAVPSCLTVAVFRENVGG